MNTFIKLFIAEIKSTLRNRQALFWRLVFPIIFIVTFGLFKLDAIAASKMIVIDQANVEVSHKIIEGFKKIDFLKIESPAGLVDLDQARAKLKRNELDFVLVLPSSIKDIKTDLAPTVTIDPKTSQPVITPPPKPEPIKLAVFYNEANVGANQLVLNLLNQITTEINAQAVDAPKLFSLESQALTNRKIRYIDFLMPGVIAMSLMQSALIGIAVYLTEYREKKILKRLLATPLDRKTFVGAQVLAKLVLAVVQGGIIIATAKILYDVRVFGSLWAVAGWVVLGSLAFLNIGFIIASVSKTATAAESLSQVISLPMMFLSGVFFSTETLPKVVKMVVDKLPLAPTIDALRKIILTSEPFWQTREQLIVVACWIAGTFLIALWRFRLARE